MQDRLYGWKYTGWVLSIFYIWLIFFVPWFPAALTYYAAVKQENAKSSEGPSQPDFLLPESLESANQRAQSERQKQQCARAIICRIADYHTILIFDKTLDDPTALFSFILAISTIGLWIQTRNLAKKADAQSQDIQTELAIGRDDFVSTHRPWVAFETKIGARGIWYETDGSLRFTLVFTCKNIGTTPALGVSVNSNAYLWVPIPSDVETQKTICKSLSVPMTNDHVAGTAIFPEAVEPIEVTYGITKANLDAYVAQGKSIIITIAGCVDYEFSFGAHVAHQSGFIYYLGKPHPTKATLAPILPMEGNKLATDLKLIKSIAANAFFAT